MRTRLPTFTSHVPCGLVTWSPVAVAVIRVAPAGSGVRGGQENDAGGVASGVPRPQAASANATSTNPGAARRITRTILSARWPWRSLKAVEESAESFPHAAPADRARRGRAHDVLHDVEVRRRRHRERLVREAAQVARRRGVDGEHVRARLARALYVVEQAFRRRVRRDDEQRLAPPRQ